MDRETLMEGISELLEKLGKAEPGSKEAIKIKEDIEIYSKLWERTNEDERVVNERQDRNRRYDLDEMKYEAERREARSRDKNVLIDAISRIVEKVLMIGGAAGLLILVYCVQEHNLIDSKAWALFLKLFKV